MEFLFRHDKIREGQKDLLRDIFDCISDKKHLVVHAPTGIGKTDAAISATLPYAVENEKTIFFLTPKITQHKIAVESVRGLTKKHNMKILGTDLLGKKHMCVNKNLLEAESENFYDLCQKMKKHETCPFYGYARGYSTAQKAVANVNFSQVMDWYGNIREHGEVKSFCESLGRTLMPKIPCAYEVSLRLAEKSNIIIADYYHLLNISIYEQILKKTNKSLEDCIVIIDEAHNAPSRIRSALSVSLDTYTLQKATKEAKMMGNYSLAKFLHEIEIQIKSRGKGIETEKRIFIESIPEVDLGMAIDIQDLGIEYLEKFKKHVSYLVKVGTFYQSWNKESNSHLRVLKKWERGEGFSVVYKCLDPSIFTKDFCDKTHSTILMSGTLKPQTMYRNLLGLEENRTLLKEYQSPFPKENRVTVIDDSVTTKYTHRNYENYVTIAKKCAQITNKIPGNSAIFFPSYVVMGKVKTILEDLSNKPLIIQDSGSDMIEVNSQINRFKLMQDEGAVLLGVLGGRFAEGIDLPGKELLGVIIVGIPFGTPNLETKALIQYYDYKFNKGWAYGYEYPALIKSIQAAGRCIRTETDKGIIVFMDNRYKFPKYLNCIPKEYGVTITQEPRTLIKGFFD